MATIAPFSALNLYNAKPVGSVVSEGKAADAATVTNTTAPPANQPSALDQVFSSPGAEDFAYEQKLTKLSMQNFVMAMANNSSSITQLFGSGSADQSMNTLLNMMYNGPSVDTSKMYQAPTPTGQTQTSLAKALLA
jgi:hypothetical protein